MFDIRFGSENREAAIRKVSEDDHNTAVILAAVHFEWMLKRAILKLGKAPTKALRDELEDVFRIPDRKWKDGHIQLGYKSIWKREIGGEAPLGKILGKLERIQKHALNVRGRVVHGNGTVGRQDGTLAVELFLGVGDKLRKFAAQRGEDLDTRLRTRIKQR